MEPADVELFLARLSLREDTPPEVDAFVAWASARFPDGPRLQLLAGYRPILEDLDQAFLLPTLEEAGLALPEPLDALRTLARHEMRRVVTGEISPEEGAGNIDMYVSSSPVDHEVVAAIPEIWNFCVYRRYLRAACDVGESGWYAEVVRDIVAEAEYHLGLRDRPPPDQGEPREPAPTSRPPDVPASPARVFNPLDVLAAARSGVDLYETPMNDDSLAPTLAIDDRSADEFYSLALAYENGTGVPRDQARAVAWYRKAANLGHPAALNNLGCLYDTGNGVAADRARALANWQAAAELGNAYAQCSLGFACETGNGVPQDHQQALAWYRRSAEGGCGSAHANLGNYLLAGEHLPRDLQLAASHFRRGAELGDARAQYKLGTLYQQGLGVERDFERAAEWFRRAYETLSRRAGRA